MPDVIMQYDTMNKMTQAFKQASEQLENCSKMLKGDSGKLQGGALLGKGGQKLLDLIDNGIVPFTTQLQQKMEELAGDVDGARAYLEEGDESAASKFK